MLNPLLDLALTHQSIAEVQMGYGRVGFDAQGYVKETDGVNILPLVGQSKTQIVEGRKTIGVDPQGVFKKSFGVMPVRDQPETAQQKKP